MKARTLQKAKGRNQKYLFRKTVAKKEITYQLYIQTSSITMIFTESNNPLFPKGLFLY